MTLETRTKTVREGGGGFERGQWNNGERRPINIVINEESFRVTKENRGRVVSSLEGNLTVAAIDNKDEHAASNGIP